MQARVGDARQAASLLTGAVRANVLPRRVRVRFARIHSWCSGAAVMRGCANEG